MHKLQKKLFLVFRVILLSIISCITTSLCNLPTLTKLTTDMLSHFPERSSSMREKLLSGDIWYPTGHSFLRLYHILLGHAIADPLAALTFSDASLTDFGHSAISDDFGTSAASFMIHAPEWFMQKIVIDPDAIVIVIGDLYGNLHAFLRILWALAINKIINNRLKLTSLKIYLIFSGNYSNYGLYGLEIWYLLLRLRKNNPQNVIIMRGASESGAIPDAGHISFAHERGKGLNHDEETPLTEVIQQQYQKFPVGVLVCTRKTDATESQCVLISGGGVPTGYDPRPFLSNRRPLAALTDEQANALTDPHYLARDGNEQRAYTWITHCVDAATGKPVINGIIAGGAHFQRTHFQLFPRSTSTSMLPSLTPHKPPTLETRRSELFLYDTSLLPIARVSSVVDLGEQTIESATIWIPQENRFSHFAPLQVPKGSGYGKLSFVRGAKPFAFNWEASPCPHPVPLLAHTKIMK